MLHTIETTGLYVLEKAAENKWKALFSATFSVYGDEIKLRKIRFLCLIAAAAGLILALTACHGTTELVVGVDIKQIPLSYRDDQNSIAGFEIDMATEAAKRAGMTVKFVPINWSQRDQALKSGRINSIWGELTVTQQEEKNVLFTKPYMYNSDIFIVSSDSEIKSKQDLAGLSVGTMQGSQAAADIRADAIASKLADGGPLIYNDNGILFVALQSGQIEAVAVDETMGEYYINQNTFDYRVLPDKLRTVRYSVGFRRDDSRLRNSIQTALASMAKDGTSKSLSMKWFGKDYTLK